MVDQLAVHFTVCGNLIFKDSDEGRRQSMRQSMGRLSGLGVFGGMYMPALGGIGHLSSVLFCVGNLCWYVKQCRNVRCIRKILSFSLQSSPSLCCLGKIKQDRKYLKKNTQVCVSVSGVRRQPPATSNLIPI